MESSRIVADAAAAEVNKPVGQPEALAPEAVVEEEEAAEQGGQLPAEAVKEELAEEEEEEEDELPAEAVVEEEEEYEYEEDENLGAEAAVDEPTALVKDGSPLRPEAVQGIWLPCPPLTQLCPYSLGKHCTDTAQTH